MEGLLFLGAMIAIAVAIFHAVAEEPRRRDDMIAKANSARRGSLQNLAAAPPAADKPTRRRNF